MQHEIHIHIEWYHCFGGPVVVTVMALDEDSGSIPSIGLESVIKIFHLEVLNSRQDIALLRSLATDSTLSHRACT